MYSHLLFHDILCSSLPLVSGYTKPDQLLLLWFQFCGERIKKEKSFQKQEKGMFKLDETSV